MLSAVNETEVLKRQEELYNASTREHKPKNSKLYSPLKLESQLIALLFFLIMDF